MAKILASVYEHLSLVKEDPSKPLDDLLLWKINDSISENLSEEERTRLIRAAQEVLPTLQQDPSPLVAFLKRLIDPDAFTFEQVDAFLTQNSQNPDDQYLMGLESENKDINMLTLSLLHKARKSPSGVGLVASKTKVVRAFIRVFLTSPEVGVTGKASEVLEGLLLVGPTPEDATAEKNLMVRRIFRDRDIYESLFSLTSLKTMGAEGQPSKNQKTIAQARLLKLLMKIDHSSSPIRVSQFPDIERQFDVTDSKHGIIYYAFVKMIDFKDDDLLLSTYIQLCTTCLRTKEGPFGQDTSTYALMLLKENHIHARCMSYFLVPSADQGSWLMMDSAGYLARYSEWHEDDLLKDKGLCNQIMDRLNYMSEVDVTSEWQVGAIASLLAVEGSLPRRLLLPTNIEASHGLPPLFNRPAYLKSPSTLVHLQRIFCEPRGPHKSSSGPLTAAHRADRMMGRVLYLKYLERNPQFWKEVIEIAGNEADPKEALNAIDFMSAFVDADWETVDQSLVPYLPSEEQLLDMREGHETPTSGLEGMFLESGVAMPMMSYFMATKPQMAHMPEVWEQLGSSKDPASEVPRARFRLAIRVRDLLLKEVTREGHSPIMEDFLDGFQTMFQNNARNMREKPPAQGGADSVATMRR